MYVCGVSLCVIGASCTGRAVTYDQLDDGYLFGIFRIFDQFLVSHGYNDKIEECSFRCLQKLILLICMFI